MVLSPLFSTTDIAMLIVSVGTVLLGGFRDSLVFIFLVVLHIPMDLPVLLRGEIFPVTPGTNLSRFAKVVADNIISGFM